MRFGVCIGNDNKKIAMAKEFGFDYAESGFSMLAEEKEAAEYDAFGEELARVGFTCESVNCFLPGSLPVCGPNVDEAALAAYVKRGMARGSALGVKTVVFGSSGARRVPEGFPYDEAVRQLLRFLQTIAGPLAAENGITIVMEPLQKKDTNLINTAKEGAILAAATGLSNVRALVDLYHMEQVGDCFDDILPMKGLLMHAHIAEPKRRVYPASAEEFDYKGFVSALEAVECPRCSLEARCDDFAVEGQIAAQVLRSL